MTRPRMAMFELICTSWLEPVRNIRHQNPDRTITAPNVASDGASAARQSVAPYIPAQNTTDRRRRCRRRVEATAPMRAPAATRAFSIPYPPAPIRKTWSAKAARITGRLIAKTAMNPAISHGQ
ncbi:hypothetical protein AS031_10215 [Pseudarthrobacter enclensis]|uniref:Uncharacterized protein n=1 Tax=Pseudarthrobacter enclensis TaxID=993070 RepID=A0A0V8IQI8_9MICC|nr:hypothetical protein AS031_10215 [Pseudarthrobacter enclensis]